MVEMVGFLIKPKQTNPNPKPNALILPGKHLQQSQKTYHFVVAKMVYFILFSYSKNVYQDARSMSPLTLVN
jgi:hypothetical protein